MKSRLFGACVFVVLLGANSVWAADPPPARIPNDPNKGHAERAGHEAKLREAFAAKLVSQAHGFTQRPDDALFLEGTLFLLATGTADVPGETQPFEILHRLAQRRWRAPLEESAEAMWTRLQAELEFIPSGDLAKHRLVAAAYEELAKRPYPHEWRNQRVFWKDLVESLLRSKAERNPADMWRKKVAASKEHGPLFRRAYAAAAIAKEAELDKDLVLPLLEAGEPKTSEIERVAEVLRIFALAKLPADDPTRLDLWLRLEPLLSKELTVADLKALARLNDQGKLRSVLLRESSPFNFQQYAAFAKIPLAQVRQSFLGKEFKAAYKEAPLCDVLKELQAAVALPLWFDAVALVDRAPITLDATAPWFDVLEQVLAQTDYRFEALHQDLYFVGKPARISAARALWERSLARAAAAEGKAGEALRDDTSVRFAAIPLNDVADILSDLHGVSVITLHGALAKVRITLECQGLPLHLALELISDQAKLDWTTAGGPIALGSPHDIEAVRKLATQHIRRSVQMNEGRARHALSDPTTLEFIETPLWDVCAYLSDLHGIPVAVSPGDSASRPMTKHLKGLELGWALDYMLLEARLVWSSDGEAVYVGSKAEVEEFRKQAASRAARRKSYPEKLSAQLAKPIRVLLEDVTLNAAAPKLAELIGLPVELSDDAELGKTPIRSHLYSTPADVALDLISLQHGISWTPTEKGRAVQIP